MLDLEEIKDLFLREWGKETRDIKAIFTTKIKTISELVKFEELTNEAKAYVASVIILESHPSPGRFQGNGDGGWYIFNFFRDISNYGPLLEERNPKSMEVALYILSQIVPPGPIHSESEFILQGGKALATMFLASQLERFFREKNVYTDSEGKVLGKLPPELLTTLGWKNKRNAIYSIGDLYVCYCYENTTKTATYLKDIDEKLTKGLPELPLSKRLKDVRNNMMHGAFTDYFSEGQFYALLYAMIYYLEK